MECIWVIYHKDNEVCSKCFNTICWRCSGSLNSKTKCLDCIVYWTIRKKNKERIQKSRSYNNKMNKPRSKL